jgi:ubiquinone/menaquinone biosynthesis C-methylase UbiE
MITTFKNFLQKKGLPGSGLSAEYAYDIWSAFYDNQPGNLMLDLDEQIFSDLIANLDLKNKTVADIGCGTGRHWQKIYLKNPSVVMGFDVSGAMLDQLKNKFSGAITQKTTDNLLATIPDSSVDCVISTLTIAHISHIEEAIASWYRILKNDGDLVITDFHPSILEKGGKRSFNHKGRTLSVRNYIHTVEKIKNVLCQVGFLLNKEEIRTVNEKVKSYYQTQNAIPVYERFFGMPVIYGLHLRKKSAAE